MCAAAWAGCAHGPNGARQPAATPGPAVHATLVLRPLDLSPDGEARLLVAVRYADAAGTPATISPGGHVDVVPSRGQSQWQPRARFGGPSAIVRVTEPGPLEITVTSDLARLPHRLTATTDTHGWRLPGVVVRALGPHDVAVGWFPRVHAGAVEIVRVAPDGTRTAFEEPAPASSFRDPTVGAGAHYTYEIRRPGAAVARAGVDVPAELPPSTSDVLRGKAMWLSFDDDIAGWNVDAMLDRARAAGLHAILLRLCYGEYSEVTAARRAAVDTFIDGAAKRGIEIVAWTVPRAVSFEDLAANVAAASYRTAAGNGPHGLAVDLERGAEFLGSGEAGRAALGAYLGRLREAVGARVMLAATVEDPYIENLSGNDVPYAAIAADADVLQPMVYWRARSAGASIAGMQAALAGSYALLRRFAGPDIPIAFGGQTASLGNKPGAPPPDEIAASIVAAAQSGAIGLAFFDWGGTSAAQWNAIGSVVWPGFEAPPPAPATTSSPDP